MIAAHGIRVARSGRTLLAVAELSLAGGIVTGVVGPNGAGKSTLTRVLAGELHPDTGDVRFEGVPIAAIAPTALAQRRAVLPQSSTLGFPLAAEDVVRLGRIPHAGAVAAAEDEAAVAAAMAEAGVVHLAHRGMATLSGGEAQRVQLARVLCQLAGPDPARTALFLDEPTASLDLAHAHAILAAAAARARAGAAVLAVLHDLSLAARWCDRVLVMEAGRIIADGVPADVLDDALVSRVWGIAVRRLAGEGARDLAFLATQA
ncbi:heme ABC transporter ATP-binding protein [Elioraea sp.]|uniref:heme ABC transporter ATP-binding protein n=1 Tax=Elioraea sp. TaxID=2185103 RepID=UPI0025C62759|nr:heme ABC transporter ATP-binding protein [Elioraea sp.]